MHHNLLQGESRGPTPPAPVPATACPAHPRLPLLLLPLLSSGCSILLGLGLSSSRRLLHVTNKMPCMRVRSVAHHSPSSPAHCTPKPLKNASALAHTRLSNQCSGCGSATCALLPPLQQPHLLLLQLLLCLLNSCLPLLLSSGSGSRRCRGCGCGGSRCWCGRCCLLGCWRRLGS